MIQSPKFPLPKAHVAIVGAGASGVMLASALVRPPISLNVVLVDPNPGRGLAHGGRDPYRLLNTRAGDMSLDPQSPSGFLDWLNVYRERSGGWSAEAFAPRSHFGDYLEHRLRTLEERTPGLGSTRIARARALAAERTAEGWSIRLDDGQRLTAGLLVLATGWAKPRPLIFHGREQIEAQVQDDPWDEAALHRLPPGGEVLLIGSGLTALDVAEAVWRRDPTTKVTAVSRHGLLPRAHVAPGGERPTFSPPYPKTARELYAKLRSAAEFVDGDSALRPGGTSRLREAAAALWAALPVDERATFLRLFRRYWEVERHRAPPSQAQAIKDALAEGRLQVVRGRLAEGKALPSGLCARAALITSQGPEARTVSRIINCTGLETDPFRSRNPLLLDLLAQGLAAADPLGLGLHTGGEGEVLDAQGRPTPGLYALGPPTQGQVFEVTAVPEIRARAASLASLVLDHARPRQPQEA